MKAYYCKPTTEATDVLMERLLHPQGTIAIDTETISLKDRTCVGIGVAVSPEESFYIPVLPERGEVLIDVLDLLANPDVVKLYHNANYDIGVLRQLATEEDAPQPDVWNIHDTSIMAQVSGMYTALDLLGQSILDMPHMPSIQELLATAREQGVKRPTMLDVDQAGLRRKCMNDVQTTFALYNHFLSILGKEATDCYQVDLRLLGVLKTIETRGLLLDHDRLDSLHTSLQREIMGYEDICRREGFSPGSTQQVGYILASRGNILPFTRSRRQLQTSEKLLKRLSDPLAHMILAYRRARKLDGTYVVPWLNEERAYTHFRLDLSTGRLASYERNLQNIPPEIRDIFDPDSGVFTAADMNQVEMRLFAHITGDQRMLEAYAKGEDIHSSTQNVLWPNHVMGSSPLADKEIRVRSKTFNFAMVFDAVAATLADNTGLSVEVCEDYQRQWLNYYVEAASWMEEQRSNTLPYAESIYGRRMLVPTVDYLITERNMREWGARKHISSCRINWPIQSSAADLVKRGMLHCWDSGLGDLLRLQIHDEYLFDGDVEFPSQELAHISPLLETPWKVTKGPKWL